MTLQEYLSANNQTPSAFARVVGVNRSYIHRVLKGEQPLSRKVALTVWRNCEIKIGPLSDISDADVRALARIEAQAQAEAA